MEEGIAIVEGKDGIGLFIHSSPCPLKNSQTILGEKDNSIELEFDFNINTSG